jgi:hypothetical protein
MARHSACIDVASKPLCQNVTSAASNASSASNPRVRPTAWILVHAFINSAHPAVEDLVCGAAFWDDRSII